MKKIYYKTCSAWRANVREIAEALGIPLTPDQLVTIENADDSRTTPLTGFAEIVVWESHDA